MNTTQFLTIDQVITILENEKNVLVAKGETLVKQYNKAQELSRLIDDRLNDMRFNMRISLKWYSQEQQNRIDILHNRQNKLFIKQGYIVNQIEKILIALEYEGNYISPIFNFREFTQLQNQE